MRRRLLLFSCALYYPPRKVSFTVPKDAELVARGRHLAQLTCAVCHYDPATRKLTGIRMKDVPAFVGTVYSRNTTQDPEAGIGHYTDDELAHLLRTGIARDGSLMPYMQKPHLADDDLRAIIAFLHSNDELVAPSSDEPPRTHYTLLGRIGLKLVSPPLPYPDHEIPRPDPTDDITVGEYLVRNLGCYECHSASFTRLDRTHPEKSKGYLGGGNKLHDVSGRTAYSRNLTPDSTGLAAWSEQDFINTLKTGITRDGRVLSYPMPSFAELTDREASAIYRYLRTVPPIHNEVK